jgi:hypothetical protein
VLHGTFSKGRADEIIEGTWTREIARLMRLMVLFHNLGNRAQGDVVTISKEVACAGEDNDPQVSGICCFIN